MFTFSIISLVLLRVKGYGRKYKVSQIITILVKEKDSF